MKPNREREAYCKYCDKYMGMVDYDYVCPICEEDICESKECYDKHHEECEAPYIEWLGKRDNVFYTVKQNGRYIYYIDITNTPLQHHTEKQLTEIMRGFIFEDLDGCEVAIQTGLNEYVQKQIKEDSEALRRDLMQVKNLSNR